MNQQASVPIALELPVNCSAEEAFAVYTGKIGEWWDPRYTANPDSLADVTIEPWVGGRVYAKHADLGEHDWGIVTLWEPGRKLVHTFTLAQDSDHPTEVAVEFLPQREDSGSPDAAQEGCVLRFEHRGWTEANAPVRDKFSDWEHILRRFTVLADAKRRDPL
jgi:hypothetical protein